MTSSERARRIISEELAREATEPAPERIVTRLEQSRLLRQFYNDGESIEPRVSVDSFVPSSSATICDDIPGSTGSHSSE